MRKILVGLTISLSLCSPLASRAQAQSPQCQEDEPCWDATTMGNQCWGEPNADQPTGYEIICSTNVPEPTVADAIIVTPKFTG